MLTRRRFLGRARAAAQILEPPHQLPRWVTPSVHTLLDMAPMPTAGKLSKPTTRAVVREWDLLGYGILITADGVLHALDPAAYRTWQMHKEARPADEVASQLATEWDVELEHARRDVTAVINRLRETVDVAADV